MVTQHFKRQGVVGILKDQTLFEADTDFVIVGAELAQADALMEMRLAHAALRISNRLADLPPFLSGLGADFFEWRCCARDLKRGNGRIAAISCGNWRC